MKSSNYLSASALVLGLLLTSMMSAFNTTPGGTVTPSPEKTISNYFRFPNILIPYDASRSTNTVKVEVIFTTDITGRVTYAYAKTANPRLKQEIEKQFSGLKIPQMKENVCHSVMLNFKYLDGKN